MGFVKVKDSVYLLRVPHGGTTTGVVLLTGEQNYLIDAAGNAAEVDEHIVPALAELSLKASDIDTLICTHTHADHIGGFARLRALGVKSVAAYVRSVPKILDPLTYNIEIRKAFPENSPPPSAGLAPSTVDLAIEDGDTVGDRVMLVATPGHDDDAVCIYDRATETLICGDSVQHNGTMVQGCALYMYLDAYRSSMQKLRALSAQTAVLGHPFLPHGDLVDGREAVEGFFADALRTVDAYGDFVAAKWNNGERDLLTVAKALVEHVGGVMPDHMFLPMYTVREHMRELQKENEKQ